MTSLERLALEIVAGVVLVIATVLYLEHRGAAACKAADVAAVTKQETINEAKESKAIIEITDEDKTYHEAISAPTVPVAALNCVRVPSSRPVLPATSATSRHDAPAVVPKADSGSFDPTAKLTPIGRDADAQVAALQAYITKVCLAR